MLRFIIILVLALVVALLSWSILNATYAYDAFASKEAQSSLEVTETQTAELLSSRRTSDAIAFGLFGALLGLLCGAACNATTTVKSRIVAAVTGLLLGAVGGAMGAFLAHWHDATVAFPADPMFYWFVRWLAILLPIGIGCGIAGQIAGSSKAAIEGIVGGAIGTAVAVVIYCLAAGSLTRLESHHEIFPAHSENRLLALILAAVCISLTIASQLRKKDDSNSNSKAAEADGLVENPEKEPLSDE